ncbi:MAG: hypothetical protein R6U98_02710 [Pirellulaceae bacterium]
MLGNWVDGGIDALKRCFQLAPGAKLIPRKYLRWSIYGACLAFFGFLLAALAAFLQRKPVVGAQVVAVAMGWLGVYAVWTGVCYAMVYQSQTRLWQNLYSRSFWRPLETFHRAIPVGMLLLLPIVANLAALSILVDCLTGHWDQL